jgi:methylase of polypeptide subunit release factors
MLPYFLDNKNYLSSKDERIRYEQHQNFVDDEKYIQFLSKLFFPLKEKLSNHKEGLDFGCGPGPALAKMFNDEGYIMDVYDPYFFPMKLFFQNPMTLYLAQKS